MSYQTFHIDTDFRIRVEPAPVSNQLSDVIKQLVEEVWREEKQKKGDKLFNGQILCYLKHDSHSLTGHFISYKEYLAVLRRPELRRVLAIDTLGISGICLADGAVLWGKRASFVAEYPGRWECAPSGGLNPAMVIDGEIPLAIPFEEELREETGITREFLQSVTPLGLVYDPQSHLYEVTALLEIDEFVRNHRLKPTEEYEQLQWIDLDDLPEFIKENQEQVVPMSCYLLTNVLHSR